MVDLESLSMISCETISELNAPGDQSAALSFYIMRKLRPKEIKYLA